MEENKAYERIKELREKINYHNYRYYVLEYFVEKCKEDSQ